uniref:Uncharacterized protein n=1 Tax=Anguilla anguilla TaxID=7936 RepID=A0A0E9QGH5_ANGAN
MIQFFDTDKLLRERTLNQLR